VKGFTGDIKEDIGVFRAPGYRLKEPRPKPKIGPYLERIAQIIEEDKALPKKQNATRQTDLRTHPGDGLEGKYTQVKKQ